MSEDRLPRIWHELDDEQDLDDVLDDKRRHPVDASTSRPPDLISR